MIATLLISSDLSQREEEAKKLLTKMGLSQNNPDVLWFGKEEKLGIEVARSIQQFLSLKSYQGRGQAIVLVAAENLTPEAQNALLKILEEPPGECIFILGIISEEYLLPTITSRCQTIILQKKQEPRNIIKKYQSEIEKLPACSYQKRFELIEKLEDRGEFLDALTSYYRELLLQKGNREGKKQISHFLKDLVEAQKWTHQNVNIRAILEYLMLKMPQN